MKVWCIIDLANLRPAEPYEKAPVGKLVLNSGHPHCFHENRDTAEVELIRLQQRYPIGDFHLFESVAKAVPSLVVQAIHVEPELPF